jgi:hypothetical protein
LCVRLSAYAPEGFIAFGHAGDDWRECRDYVRERMGLPRRTGPRQPSEARGAAPEAAPEEEHDVRAVHVVRLAPDGRSRLDKITVGRGALGSPIVVAPLNDGLGLAITEGIEDALSIHIATGLGAWATGGASRMPAIAETVPTYCECVTVIGDDNDTGHKNAGELAARLGARGIEAVLKVIGAGLAEAAGR